MQNGIPFSILIVDDDSDDLLIVDEAFKEIGYDAEVRKFLNGKALLHYLDSITTDLYPSLIVLDSTLPELDASDLLSILKGTEAFKTIPVVVYTTSLSPLKREQLMARGAHACFIKGASIEEVVHVAKELRGLAEGAKQGGVATPE